MRRSALRFAATVLLALFAAPTMLSAADSNGEGYPSWGTFHPWLCAGGGCELWDDAATPSGTTRSGCDPLTKWQNGIDVDYRCG